MKELYTINLNGTKLELVDFFARTTARTALDKANEAKNTADEAKNTADEAKNTADSKVSISYNENTSTIVIN